MLPKKVYLFNTKIDTFLFVSALIVLLFLSSFLRVYYHVEKKSEVSSSIKKATNPGDEALN